MPSVAKRARSHAHARAPQPEGSAGRAAAGAAPQRGARTEDARAATHGLVTSRPAAGRTHASATAHDSEVSGVHAAELLDEEPAAESGVEASQAAAAPGEAPGTPGAPTALGGRRVRPSIAVPAGGSVAGAAPDLAAALADATAAAGAAPFLGLESPAAAPSPAAPDGSLLFPISPQRSVNLT